MAKNKGGRPSKYDSIDLKQVEQLASRGWTDAEMSKFFSITEQTWCNWKKEHPEFFESLKDWKVEADARVERSLYERATGYSHPDVKIFKSAGEAPVTVDIIKHYPPDPTSCIFWLKNRDKENWRDRPDEQGNLQDVAETIRAMREAILNSAIPEEATS